MKRSGMLLMVMALILGVILLSIKNTIDEYAVMYLAFIPFFMFVFGLMAWIIREKWGKLRFFGQLVFALSMGVMFYVLLAIHVFVLEPWLCPCLRP